MEGKRKAEIGYRQRAQRFIWPGGGTRASSLLKMHGSVPENGAYNN